MKWISKKIITVVVALMSATTLLHAQQKPAAPSEEELKKANDPMANVKAFDVQDYIVSKLYGTDAQVNQLLIRYSQPIGPFLIRATMPFVVSSSPTTAPLTGLSDLNLFAIYSFPSTNGNKFGIGPSLSVPTGTHNLGTGKWQTGITALAFFAKSHIVQIGSLLQWSTSFSGDKDLPDISTLNPQMFFIWQLGAGFNIRSTGVWSFNLKNGDYSVPIGLGVGKVVKAGKTVFNLFAEPQFTVLAEGAGQPKFQTFIGFNTQF